MSQESDLKVLARRAYLSYHQDGLIDVMVGWMLFSFGLYLLLDSAAVIFISWFPLLFYVPIKTTLTIPRLGYVNFSGDFSQKNQKRLGLTVTSVLVVSVLVISMFVLAGKNGMMTLTSLRENGMLVYGSVTAILLLIAGLVSGIRRLAVYGLLCSVLAIAGMLADLPDYLLFIALGLVILLVGAVMMLIFIRKYPLARNGGDHATE
jgi:hypothetical protein